MQLRQRIRIFFESYDLYFRIRYSDFYLKNFQKRHASINSVLQAEKLYYLSLLENLKKDKRIIFDVGANEGFISNFFLEENFKVVAIEPDQRNQKVLMARFNHQDQFFLIKKGVSDVQKSAHFFIHNRNSSLNTFSPKWKESIESKKQDEGFSNQQKIVELTTLDHIIKEVGIPSFIKIDVEGHEWEVIKGLNTRIPLLSFEANFPEFKEETFWIIEKLMEIDPNSEFNFSKEYKLEFPQFVSDIELKRKLNIFEEIICLEIICKMSSYTNFFEIKKSLG